MVLSQFFTFTTVSPISVTTPSAPYLGMDIQSPHWSMSLADSWTEATNPSMASLNTSIMTAAEAPSPASILNGDLSMKVDTAIITTTIATVSFIICTNPRMYLWLLADMRSLNVSTAPDRNIQRTM